MNRIPSLDGWRGIAIVLVLFDHAQNALAGAPLRPWMQTGQHGVTIFFVLSGFLITSKLLEGPVDLKKFYVRRLLRLLPVAWTYLAALWILGMVTGHELVFGEALRASVFCYLNFLGPCGSSFTDHFWSLSIECQFYLVWPCLFLLAGAGRAKWCAVSGLLICAIWRLSNWAYYDRLYVNFHTEARADALFVGCLLAFLLAKPALYTETARWWKLCSFPAFALLLFCIVRFQRLPPLYESMAIAELIAASILNPQSVPARFLSFPALTWLGTVSYSVYVWQQFFFAYRGTASITIVAMCMMPSCALTSYYFVECKFMHILRR